MGINNTEDLYDAYIKGCDTHPQRSKWDLIDLWHAADSRFDDERSIEAFWILVFGFDNDKDEHTWALDPNSDTIYPDQGHWDAYYNALPEHIDTIRGG